MPVGKGRVRPHYHAVSDAIGRRDQLSPADLIVALRAQHRYDQIPLLIGLYFTLSVAQSTGYIKILTLKFTGLYLEAQK